MRGGEIGEEIQERDAGERVNSKNVDQNTFVWWAKQYMYPFNIFNLIVYLFYIY